MSYTMMMRSELKKVENSKIFNKKYLDSIDEVIISPWVKARSSSCTTISGYKSSN
jgi:hypothetical protein